MWRFRDGAENGHFVSLNFIWRTNHSSPSSDMLPYVGIIWTWIIHLSCLEKKAIGAASQGQIVKALSLESDSPLDL